MTTARKQQATRARNNPTSAETMLWEEIRGLATGTRFVRKKFRCGFLTDFYSDSLKLAVIITGTKRYRDNDIDPRLLDLLRSTGFFVKAVSTASIIDHAGRVKVDIMRYVYDCLYIACQPVISVMYGVTNVRLDHDNFTINVELEKQKGEIDKTRLEHEVSWRIRKFAAGANIKFTETEAEAEPVVAEEKPTESTVVTEI